MLMSFFEAIEVSFFYLLAQRRTSSKSNNNYSASLLQRLAEKITVLTCRSSKLDFELQNLSPAHH